MSEPIPMLLWCPSCGERHIDRGEFATKPHHTHACQKCGMVWRPAVVHTVGVQFLPGFRDGPKADVSTMDLVMSMQSCAETPSAAQCTRKRNAMTAEIEAFTALKDRVHEQGRHVFAGDKSGIDAIDYAVAIIEGDIAAARHEYQAVCTCPATSEYDDPCPRHGVLGIGVRGTG
jgi:hypothetical protein